MSKESQAMEDKLGRKTGKQESRTASLSTNPSSCGYSTGDYFSVKTATTMSDFETETRDNLKQ